MSNLGKWERWYRSCREDDPRPYGGTDSYQLAVDWLADCQTVEDWGCGKGWAKALIGADRYVGVDGSRSPWADRIADLADYRSDVDGILLRHVLEHDERWADILANALASARQRIALVFFIAPGRGATKDLRFEADPGVPNLRIDRRELHKQITSAGATWEAVPLPAPAGAHFGGEVLYRIEVGR